MRLSSFCESILRIFQESNESISCMLVKLANVVRVLEPGLLIFLHLMILGLCWKFRLLVQIFIGELDNLKITSGTFFSLIVSS
jgi:hypothetical protein